MAKIEARRRLDDLFMKGVEIRFGRDPETEEPWAKVGPFEDDEKNRIAPGEDELCMFIRPPNPVQRDEALRNAQAKRALSLVRTKRDEGSEEHLTVMAFLADMSDDILVDYVLMSNANERGQEAERDTLSQEEWKDMTSYTDAARQFAEMPPEEMENDPDWKAFQELDERFTQQVNEREAELREADAEGLKILIGSGNRDKVEQKALKRRADFAGTQAFINEYERWMNYYAVREVDDPNMLWFANVDEFASVDDVVRETIAQALEPFIPDGTTAKNSPRAASGSSSSVLPETPETSESSTPETPSE